MATGLTVMYTLRLILYSLSGEYNLRCITNLSDEEFLITILVRILGLGAILGGSPLR